MHCLGAGVKKKKLNVHIFGASVKIQIKKEQNIMHILSVTLTKERNMHILGAGV